MEASAKRRRHQFLDEQRAERIAFGWPVDGNGLNAVFRFSKNVMKAGHGNPLAQQYNFSRLNFPRLRGEPIVAQFSFACRGSKSQESSGILISALIFVSIKKKK